jgi:phospholipid/cholesterol/gamma-HCH transport system substrate-binding protein
MQRTTVHYAVGLFVIVGVLSLSFLAIKMGDVGLGEDGAYPVKARFISVSGLRVGAVVELAGVRIGKVSKIELDGAEYQAEVLLSIDDGVRIHDDAIASIRTAGIIGDKFVKITPGGSDRYLEPGMEIVETESSISLEELISKYIFEASK